MIWPLLSRRRIDCCDFVGRNRQAVLFSVRPIAARENLPKLTSSISLMDAFHASAVRESCQFRHSFNAELFGTNCDGEPLKNFHRHAHWIPNCLQKEGSIDHVIAFAEQGFAANSIHCLRNISKIYAAEIPAVSVRVLKVGSYWQVQNKMRRHCLRYRFGFTRVPFSKTWTSYTPLILKKHLNQSGRKSVRGQVVEELRERGFPAPERIDIWPSDRVNQLFKNFVVRRKVGKNQPPSCRMWGISIEFDKPINNRPLSLGYASHFGLGQIKPQIFTESL